MNQMSSQIETFVGLCQNSEYFRLYLSGDTTREYDAWLLDPPALHF